MKKQKNALFSALPIVAAAYAERFGVKVNIGGDVAYTDGKSINLPNIPEDYPHKDALWGYLAHEGAHVRFTDFQVSRKPGIHAELTNIIEDCRIEQLMIKAYPGTGKTLLDTAEYMLQAGHYQVPTGDNHPAQVLSAFCLYFLQAHGVGQAPLLKPLQDTDKVFRDLFPKGSYVRINALLRKCIGSKSTQEAADLATDILKMIEEEEEKEQQQESGDQDESKSNDKSDEQSQSNNQGAGQNQDDDKSDDDRGQGSSQGQDDDKSDDDGNNDNDQGADDGQGDSQDQSAGDPSSNDDQQSQNSGGPGSSSQDQSDDDSPGPSIAQQVLSAEGDDLLGNAHSSLLKELDEVAENSGNSDYCTVHEALKVNPVSSSGDELLAEAKTTSAGIRQQLNGLVQATQREATRHTRTGRRISTSRLARVRTGETRVFTQSTDKVAPNTAVHILLDMSGSMSGVEATIAKEAALSIALALETIKGVNPAVTFFCGDSRHPVRSVVSHGERVKADRFHPNPSGGTPMAEAIWYAGFELSKCKEDRKLIICITDGEPNDHSSTQTALELCAASGVETIGIGIRHPAVQRLFDNSIVIQRSSELRTTLFQLMKDSLIAA